MDHSEKRKREATHRYTALYRRGFVDCDTKEVPTPSGVRRIWAKLDTLDYN